MDLYLFPLGVVLFPAAALPLHVFEERYTEMIGRCISDGRPLGIAQIVSGEEVGGRAETVDIGTVADIEQYRRLEDGRYVLIVRGTRRFRVVRRLPDDPFPVAEVELLEPETASVPVDLDSLAARARTFAWLSAEAGEGDPPRWDTLPDDPEEASFAVADILTSDPDRRQVLLEMSVDERLAQIDSSLDTEVTRLRADILSR